MLFVTLLPYWNASGARAVSISVETQDFRSLPFSRFLRLFRAQSLLA
jgi:hypothetical protein